MWNSKWRSFETVLSSSREAHPYLLELLRYYSQTRCRSQLLAQLQPVCPVLITRCSPLSKKLSNRTWTLPPCPIHCRRVRLRPGALVHGVSSSTKSTPKRSVEREDNWGNMSKYGCPIRMIWLWPWLLNSAVVQATRFVRTSEDSCQLKPPICSVIGTY